MARPTECDGCGESEAPWWITHSGTGDTSTLCNSCLLDVATRVAESMVAAVAEQVGEVPIDPDEIASDTMHEATGGDPAPARFPEGEPEAEPESPEPDENKETGNAADGQRD